MMIDKLRRYGAAAAALFLLLCAASIFQHWSYLTSWLLSFVTGVVGRLLVVVVLIFIMRLFLDLLPGVGRRR